MLDWLRRWLGESEQIAALKEEKAALEEGRRELLHQLEVMSLRHSRLEATRDKLQDSNSRLHAQFHKLTEPARVPPCEKIRLCNKVEAEQFARKTEKELQIMPGSMRGYACKICPRHPVRGHKYWHVSYDGEEEKKRGTPGRGLVTHIDPAVMARLRLSARGADE